MKWTLNWATLHYQITDYWKRHSLRTHLKRLIYAVTALYILSNIFADNNSLPSPPLASPEALDASQTILPSPSLFDGTALRHTHDDLRQQMTSQQSMFYWRSFLRMMEHAKPLEKAEFDGRVIHIAIYADTVFTAHNGLHCRAYSEKVALAGQFNRRKGIACRKGPGHWCQQPEGETAHCRTTAPKGGLASITLDKNITLHNFNVGWDRNLAKLPSF